MGQGHGAAFTPTAGQRMERAPCCTTVGGLRRASVPGPPAVPLGSCSMWPLLPGRTGSLQKEEPNTEERLLQTISNLLTVQGSQLPPSQGKPIS